MTQGEVTQKITGNISQQHEIDIIIESVGKIPEIVFSQIRDISIIPGYPLTRGNGESVPAFYDDKEEIIYIYSGAFSSENLKHFYHEVGHSIFHHFPKVAEKALEEYQRIPSFEVEVLLANGDADSISSEFCANSYERFRLGIALDDEDEKYQKLMDYFKQNDL